MSVVWITGLSGVGKTTIADKLSELLNNPRVIRLDGDSLREILNFENQYDKLQRISIAMAYSKLARYLSNQGKIVIISTISLFHDIHKWNKDNNSSYLEILLECDKNVLINRNNKNIYSNDTKISFNVVGVDIVSEFPLNPDLIFYQDFKEDSTMEIVNKIMVEMKKRSII